MRVEPLIMPAVNPSALPQSIIRRLNNEHKSIKPGTFIEELQDLLYFVFLIEGVQDHELKELFPLGGVVIETAPPNLNTIILGGTLPKWKSAFNADSFVLKEIYKMFLGTEARKYFQ